MFLNNTRKIDYSTDVVEGMVWAKDYNVLVKNFNNVLIETGIDNLRRAIEKICKPVITVINSNMISSNFAFDISYFIAESANTNKVFLTIVNQYFEIKSANGYSLPQGYIQKGDAVIVYRSHDGNYYTTGKIKRLPDLLELINAKAVMGTTVFNLAPNQRDNDQTFSEWVNDMYVYCHTPYGVKCVQFDGTSNDKGVIKKIKSGNQYHLLSYFDFRVVWYRYETTSTFANGGSEIITNEYTGTPYAPLRNLYLDHKKAKQTNIDTSPYSLGCPTYAYTAYHEITFQHLASRTRVLGKWGVEWTQNLSSVGQSSIIPQGVGSDIVNKYSTILLEKMIPVNGNSLQDIQVGYPTELTHGANVQKVTEMNLLNRDRGFSTLNGVTGETILNTIPIDINVKPNLPKGDDYTYGIYYGGIAPSLTFANFETKTEETVKPNPLIYTTSALDKGSAGVLRIGREANIEVVDTSIASVELDDVTYTGTNYIKFDESVWSFGGSTLSNEGVIPNSLLGMTHGDTCTIGNNEGSLYSSYVLNYKNVSFGQPTTSYLGYLIDKENNEGFVIGTNKANLGGVPGNNPNHFVQELSFGGAKIIRVCDDGPVWFYLTDSGALFRQGTNNAPVLVTEDNVIWFAVSASPDYDNLVYITKDKHVKASLAESSSASMYSRFIDLGVTNTYTYLFDRLCLSAHGVVAFPTSYSTQFKKLINGNNIGSLVQNYFGGSVNYTPYGICMYDDTAGYLREARKTGMVSYSDYNMVGSSNAIVVHDATVINGLIFVAYAEFNTFKLRVSGNDGATRYLTGSWMYVSNSSGYPDSTYFNRINIVVGYNCDDITCRGAIYQYRVVRNGMGWQKIQPRGYRTEDHTTRSRTLVSLKTNYLSDKVVVIHRGDDVLVASRNIQSNTSSYVDGMGVTTIPSPSGFEGVVPKTGKCSGNAYYNYGGKTYIFMVPNTEDKILNTPNPNMPNGISLRMNFIGITPSMINGITNVGLSSSFVPTFSFNENVYGSSFQNRVVRCNAGLMWYFADDGSKTRLDDIGDADDYYYVDSDNYCYIAGGSVYAKGFGSPIFTQRTVFGGSSITFIWHDASTSTVVYFNGSDNYIYALGTCNLGYRQGTAPDVIRLDLPSSVMDNAPFSNVIGDNSSIRAISTNASTKTSQRITTTITNSAGNGQVALSYINESCKYATLFIKHDLNTVPCECLDGNNSVYLSRNNTILAKFIGKVALMYDTYNYYVPRARGFDAMNNVRNGGSSGASAFDVNIPGSNEIQRAFGNKNGKGAIYRGNSNEFYVCGDFPTGTFTGFTNNDYMVRTYDISTTNTLGMKEGIFNNHLGGLYINFNSVAGGPRPPVPPGIVNPSQSTYTSIIVVHTNMGVFRLKPGGYEPLIGSLSKMSRDLELPIPEDTYVFYADCYDDGNIRHGGLKYDGNFEYTLARGTMVTIPNAFQYGLNCLTYSKEMVACLVGTQLFVHIEDSGTDYMVMFPIASIVFGIEFEDQNTNTLSVSTEHGNGKIKFDTKEIIDLIVDEEYSKNDIYKLQLTTTGVTSSPVGYDLTEFDIQYDTDKLLS